MRIIWTVLIIFIVTEIRSKRKSRNECCKYGNDFMKEFNFNYLEQSNSYLDRCSIEVIRNSINTQNNSIFHGRLCTVYAKACCIKSLMTEICKRAASEEEDCESISNQKTTVISQIKQECCLCCLIENPIPMETFDSCNFLHGICPKKIRKGTVIGSTLSFTTNGVNYSRSEYSSTELNYTDVYNWSNSTDSPIKANMSNVTDSLVIADMSNVTDSLITADMSNVTDSLITADMSNVTDSLITMKINNDMKSSTTSDTNGTTFEVHFTYPLKLYTEKSKDTITKSTMLSTELVITTRLLICDNGFTWDAIRHVCVQMMISCPKKFILNPDTQRCVPITKPSIPCSKGYHFNQFKHRCIDIDECTTPDRCNNKSQICVNLDGSFRCECLKGFKQTKMDTCEDIDECANINICPEDKKCKNLIGSYRCVRAISCGFGWKEDIATNECVDVDECESFPDICGVGMKCVNIRGSHKCEDEECPNNMKRNNKGKCSKCRDGFKMNEMTNTCEDIDECVEKAHFYKGRCKPTENCINLPGSYECAPKKKCRPGTLLTKNGTTCEDIDECKEMTFRCSSDDICVNTYSSFQCVASPCAPSQYYDYTTQTCLCKDGYRLSSENMCEDIDECSDLGSNNQCGSMYLCINKPGGYMCINKFECSKGMYRPSMDSICQDIDECETGEGKCTTHMHCVNMVGSYKCMCDRGFILINNGSCADINECLLFRPEETCPDLEARCVNTPGSYKCQCAKGFEWSDYPLKKCIDIDECKSNINPCGIKHICVNIIGSYKCQCHSGYRLTIEGDNCEDIDECLILPKKCTNGRCINIEGRYNCQCPKGFLPDNNEICQDIDECLSFKGMCPSEYFPRRCINLMGYYKCINNSCPNEYSQTQLGNGFNCILNQEYHCELHNVGCLLSRPYRRKFEFIELQSQIELPRTLTRVNVGHLPPGNNRINLQIKYAHHTETKEPILIKNAFQFIKLTRNRNRNEEIDVILKYSIVAPAEILLYLQSNVYHKQLYLGHSEVYIHLYFTKYPDN